jgi:putative photosynthetic complex assembly protein
MSNLQAQMKHRDKEMVPLALVRAMFALMIGSVALVAYDQWSQRPIEGVMAPSPAVREVTLTLTGDRTGTYVVTDAAGAVVASSADPVSGFIGVMGRVIDRQRTVAGIADNPPVRVVLRADGYVEIHDDATGAVTELIGYGADNVAAFAQFVN